MSNDQKRKLAAALIDQAALLCEVMHDGSGYHADIEDIGLNEAKAQLARWLKNLPGGYWNVTLPQPK